MAKSDATKPWVDPDDAPELTDEQLDEAELYEGDKFIRRVGRPKGSGKKELVTLRLDREILDRFRAGGPGWQTRLNDALREATRAPAPRAVRVQARVLEQAGISKTRQGIARKHGNTLIRTLRETYGASFAPGCDP